MQKALNPMGNQVNEAEKNLSITVNNSFKFKDNILIDLTVTNISDLETNIPFNRKLKDINMMECEELTSPSYADFPLTDIEKKGFLSQKYTSTFAPGEGLRGYYCFRCPDPQINEFDLYILGKKFDINPQVITAGLNLDVAVNNNVRYADNVRLDVTISNNSNVNAYYSNDIFTLNETEGVACKSAENNRYGGQYQQFNQTGMNANKAIVLYPGDTEKESLEFVCPNQKVNDYTLIMAPVNKKEFIHLPPIMEDNLTQPVTTPENKLQEEESTNRLKM